MAYMTWERYSSRSSKVNKEDFERLLGKASIKLDAITHMRVKQFEETYNEKTATDFHKQVHGQIELTLCELMDSLYVRETSDMGSGISSVSNDGYSESYKITTASEMESQLVQIIRSGLSGTGLAGVL